MDRNKIISFLLAFVMILGIFVDPVFAISSNRNEAKEVNYEIQEIDGKAYKVYKVSDIGLKNPEKLLTPKYRTRAAGDPMEDWVKINIQSRTVGLTLGNDFHVEVYVALRKDDTKIAKAIINPTYEDVENVIFHFVKTAEYDENNPDHQDPDKWYLYVEDNFQYDIRLGYGESGNFGSESMTMTIQQRAMPLYKAVWFTNNQQRPVVDAIYNDGDNIANNVKLNTKDFAENEYKSFSSEKMPLYVAQKEVIVKDENLGTVDKEKFLVSDMKGAALWKLLIDQKTKGTIEDGATKYHFNITGDYKTPFVATMREELKVKFDPNGATFDQAVKAEQPIGHSMKIGETFGDLEAVTVPTKDQISNIPQKDNKDQEFVGWVDNEANKSLDFSNGQNADKLVNPNGYEVKKNVTFYAVYAPVAQGRVAVQYVDADGNAIKDKYKIKDEKYPDHAEGNKGKPVEASKIKEPKFIGYKRTADTIADAVKNKTYKTDQIETVEVKYEKLPDIIPEKKNGQDNPDVTTEVKEHYAKVTFQVAADDAKKAKLQLAGADATSPLVYYVNPVEGIAIKDVANVNAVSKDANLYNVDANDMWKFDPESITSTDQKILQARDSEDNVVETKITLTAKVADKTAAKFKDKLDPQDIKVWEKDPIDWKKGVKLKEANEELQKILDKTETKVTDESNRNSDAANLPNGQKGNLKVTFEDGSSIEIKDQTLYVAPHKNDNNTNLPEDAIKVDFKIGEGVNGEAKTEYVKPGTDVKEDAPTVTLKEGFKEAKWYKGNAVATDADYKVTANVEFTAKATPKGQGSAQVEYHVGTKNITDKIADLKIDGQTYPANKKLTGTEDSAIDTTKITQPELIGYKKVNITTEPDTDAKYTEAGTAKVIFNYEKIDDIIGPVKPGDKIPTGYVTVAFKAATGAELDPGETSYFVNPKAETKAKISKVGDNYQISGKKADGTDLTGNVPAVTSTDENKYEIQYADGEAKKWAYDNFNKVGQDITTDTTFTAQVTKLGEPNVTFPPVEIEKGGSKVVTPEVKDKHNKKIEKPGKPEVNEKPDGVNVTPNDDGTVKIEVPKDYKGPGTFTIKVTYKIDGKDVPGVITVKIKEDKKPEPKPEPVPEVEIPGIKYKDHYTPTYPVYVSVPDKKVPVQDIFTHEQYIFGYPDDTIRPDGDMTRAEAIAVVARLQKLDLSDKTSNIYKDTKAGMWYNAAINAAFREGYLLEKEGENIRPNDKITRAELALLISHIDKKNDTVAPFEDVKGHKFEAAINQAYGNERIKGYPDGTFKPDNSITRAEVATMLNKLYDRYPDKNYIDANQNLVHNYKDMSYKGHWGYYELVEAYHTHKFARLANNMEEWKAIIK